MKKPSVYLDTTIFSMYYNRSNDVITHSNRLKTREWWSVEREHFEVFASSVVMRELSDGVYPWQVDSIRMALRLKWLAVPRRAQKLAEELTSAGAIPKSKPGDALQMAIATYHSMDYLLTWNYSHLANPTAQRKMEEVVKSFGLQPPLMVSPETIPQVRFGYDPRRR
jgi:hypothetical protein